MKANRRKRLRLDDTAAYMPLTVLVIVGIILTFEYLVLLPENSEELDNVIKKEPFGTADETYGTDLGTSTVSGSPATNDTDNGTGSNTQSILNWVGTGAICIGAGAAFITGLIPLGVAAGAACGVLLADQVFFGGGGLEAVQGAIVDTVTFAKVSIVGLASFASVLFQLLTFDIDQAPTWARFVFALPINGAIIYSVLSLVRGN